MDHGIYLNSSHQGRQETLDVTSRLYSLLGLERNGGKCFSAEINPEGEQNPNIPREKPYISTWVDRGSTWITLQDLLDTEGEEVKADTQVCIIPGACTQDESRRARTRGGDVPTTGSTEAERTDEGEWSAEEHGTLLGAVKPGEPSRQLGYTPTCEATAESSWTM